MRIAARIGMAKRLRQWRIIVLSFVGLLVALIGSPMPAAVFDLDFTTDPADLGVEFFGSAEWRESEGNPGGYLSVTDALNGQRGAIIFPDLEGGAVLTSISISADLRVGGGTARPADGFSFNFVRPDDPLLEMGEGYASSPTGEANLPEEGSTTGLAIGFDEWFSGGEDIIGMSIRIDNELVDQFEFPILNNEGPDDPDYNESLQTGPMGVFDDELDLLSWARLNINLTAENLLTVDYKGVEVFNQTIDYDPGPGQLVFGGRTGGANAYHHIDNISIRTEGSIGLEQQTVVVNTGIDTTLAEAGLNGPDTPHGEEGSNPDGVERWEWDGSDGGGVNHGLLWFDIPANTLAAFGNGTATLAMHVDNNGNAGDMHRVTENWLGEGDDATWNNMPGGPGIVPGQNAEEVSNVQFPDSIGRQGQVLEADVSEDVRAWAAGEPNYGWGFLPVGNDGYGVTSFENATNPVPQLTLVFSGAAKPLLQAGDADQDLDFDQLDLVQVQIASKYLTGAAATWGEGDWNAAPGGSQGSPPAGDGQFNQIDIIAALNAGKYLTGPYAAIVKGGSSGDGQTSITYNVATGEVGVDAPAGTNLTSINIDSASGIFTGAAAANLGGSFDNDADTNIFKATFGSEFGSLEFGAVAQMGLSEDFVANDLTVVGSLAGGGDLGTVDLIYIPEPSAGVLAALGLLGVIMCRVRRKN